jgi:hypothetical protein
MGELMKSPEGLDFANPFQADDKLRGIVNHLKMLDFNEIWMCPTGQLGDFWT